MLTSLRLKIGLLLSFVLLIVLLIKSFVPQLLVSVSSLFDSQTDSSCTTRCGNNDALPVPSSSDAVSFDSLAEVAEPKPLLLRTGFDSAIAAPPYPVIFALLALMTIGLLVYYIKVVRPVRFQPVDFVTSRVQVIHYPSHELPAEDIRQHILLFNRRLPKALQRRTEETITEWFTRIEFPSPVSPHYLEVRYGDQVSIQVHQFTFFKQTTEDFLRRVHSTLI